MAARPRRRSRLPRPCRPHPPPRRRRVRHPGRSAGPDAIASLIEKGADPNARDDAKATPLHYAARAGNAPVTRALLAAGANPLAKDATGRLPLDYAREFKLQPTIDILDPATRDAQASKRGDL